MIGLSSNAKKADKVNRIRQKTLGTPVTLRWNEWPDGRPEPDPTTGARLATDESVPVQKTFITRAWTHQVAPTQSMARKFAEIQVGDMIVDFSAPIVRVEEVGATEFEVGQVMDVYTFNAANRAVSSEDPAIPEDEEVLLQSLENLSFIIKGEVWVQQDVGKDLIMSWADTYAGALFGQAFLLRKGT